MIDTDDIVNDDCMNYMKQIEKDEVNLTLTDIPYGVVNRDGGIRNYDKGLADIPTFKIQDFLSEVYRITKNTIVIFCGKEQFSEIFKYFADKQKLNEGTVRQIVWRKTNPAPVCGQYIYLSGLENAVWFKKRGGCSMPDVRIRFLNILAEGRNCIQQKRIMVC